MRFCLVAVLLMLLSFSGAGLAQQAGSFVAGLDIGITSATGDFKNDTLEAGNGFGLGAELRYTLLNGFSFGPFVRYHRFGSSKQTTEGDISYNFAQYGGLAKLNLFDVEKGRIYAVGGGGMFKPNRHVWTPEYTTDEEWDTGMFFMGGLGLSSNPNSTSIFEFEVRYNLGEADYISTNPATGDEIKDNFKFDFLYFVFKISFNSKGQPAPPRY